MLNSIASSISAKLQSNYTLLGLNHDLSVWLLFVFIVLGIAIVSTIAFYAFRFVVLHFVASLVAVTGKGSHKFPWLEVSYKHKLFHRLSWFVPLLIIYVSLPLAVLTKLPFVDIAVSALQTMLLVMMVCCGVMVLNAFLNSVDAGYRELPISKQYSIKSYLQVIRIIVYLIAVILVISTLLDKSPAYLITGLGAMTAIGMLVFKDSILGFVASIQITAYDMVRVGDWIELPRYGADGTVRDISLNTIKVQNFDNTFVTIPSYMVLTDGIKNWRGMSESGGRRIKRSFNVDVNSIKFCDSKLLDRISRIGLMNERVTRMLNDHDPERRRVYSEISSIVNTDSCVTNLTLFRAYLEEYLSRNPKIHSGMTFLIRELQDKGTGIPVELYLFTNNTRWGVYESVQAEIFDHIFAIMPLFDLKAFQHLSGTSLQLRAQPDLEAVTS